MFCDCITLGGRMLLDVGPKEDGTLDERQEKVLEDLGTWISDHDEAVHGTGKGLNYAQFLGGSTLSATRRRSISSFMTHRGRLSASRA